MSVFTPMVFAYCVIIGVMLQLTFFDQVASCSLFAASLAFFLATIQLPFLLLKNSTTSLPPIVVSFTNYLPFATMIASLTTLMLAFPNFDQVPPWGIGWAISSGLVCIAIAVLYKSISRAAYRHCRHIAFLSLCVAFAGLYTDPLVVLLPGFAKYNSIIHGMNCLYHFAFVPLNFVFGSILVIFGIAPSAGLVLPVVSVPFKESMTALTLAVGLTTLIIAGFLTIYSVIVYFGLAGLFQVGGPGGPTHVEAM